MSDYGISIVDTMSSVYYERGKERGENIAQDLTLSEVIESLDSYDPESGDYDSEEVYDAVMTILREADENDRQTVDFSFVAQEINSYDEFDSDDLWEAYESGLTDAFTRRAKELSTIGKRD